MLRTSLSFLTLSFFALPLLVAPLSAQDAPVLDTDDKKGSYAFGLNVGSNLGPFADILDFDIFMAGLKDAIEKNDPAITDKEAAGAFEAFRKKAIAAMEIKSKEGGAAFLKKNAEDAEVVQLPSGLQYKVLKKGEGESPKKTSTVTVHYTGTLIDGTKFDSSRDRGEPSSFPVGNVIPGWTEALQLMKPGSHWMLYIPSDLAYGERGQRTIPPHSALIFDVELLSIK